MAMVVAMQPAKGLDSDDSDEGISDSDKDDDEVRIFWNIPYTECLFLNNLKIIIYNNFITATCGAFLSTGSKNALKQVES